MCLFICILVYVIVLVIGISVLMAEVNKTSSDCVKVIFWPITVVVYLLGLILWVLIRVSINLFEGIRMFVPRKLFEGIRMCLYEIKDFFVEAFDSAIEK